MMFKKLCLVALLLVSTASFGSNSRQLKAQSILNGSGVLTLPTSTDTVVGRATTDTLTNKTINGSNNTITSVSLTTGVTGTLPVGNGGTGATSLTSNNVILGNGTSAVQFVAPGTSGNVLTSNGTTWTSSASTSNVSGEATINIASAYITNSGTPTVSSQDGSWITSITDNGVGNFTINYASNTWSAAPRCFCNVAGAGGYWCNSGAVPTTTTASFRTWNVSGGGTAEDLNMQVVCIGAQ